MKNLYPLLLTSLFIFSLSACKKEVKPITTISLTGKWFIRKYILSGSENGVPSTPTIEVRSDTTSFYEFDPDGTAFESSPDPNYVEPMPFNYHITGSNLILSRPLQLLHETTCTINEPGNNELILQDSYTYQASGNNYKTVEEVDLSK